MRNAFIILALLLSRGILAQAPQKLSYQAVIRNGSDQLVANTQVGIRISILQGSIAGTAVYTETQTPNTNANGLVSIEIGGNEGFKNIDWANGPYFIQTETDPFGGTTYTIQGSSQILSVPFALNAKTAETADYNKLTNKPALFSGYYNDLNNKPDLFDGTWTSLTGKPTFATIATSGSYNDLKGLPTLFDGNYNSLANKPALFDGTWTSLNGKPTFAIVATSGNYTDLNGKPLKIGDLTGDMNNKKIINLTDPTANQDAVTKAYVDVLKQQIKVLENNLIVAGTYKLIDVEDNYYKVVKIGNQVWMAENLKTTKYNDGSTISLVADSAAWVSATTTPAYCWYNNDVANKSTYGALYNMQVVDIAGNGGKNVCPVGWHVPTDAEWNALIAYLGGTSSAANKLKESGTAHWYSPNTGATNESGFTALPGGRRETGEFGSLGSTGLWWSSTRTVTATFLWIQFMGYSSGNVVRTLGSKSSGLSVRCLRD
jgi:uncharacterized protein (TIGR02145 family)